MIIYVKMNIFESPAQVIVNTVNTVGVMGKGIAKQYKQLYPEMFKEYQKFCEAQLLDIGKLWIYKTPNKWILNFPTKKHWRNKSKIEYIEKGLQKFVDTYKERGIRSISFPPLGCGNGGLNWENEVRPLMEKYLRNLDIDIFIHLPLEKSDNNILEHKNISETKVWLNSEPNSLSFIEVWSDIRTSIDENNEITVLKEKYWMEISEPEIPENIEQGLISFLNLNDEVAFTISKEEIYETWRLLRDTGILTDEMLPEHLKRNRVIIFSLLVTLSYIDPMPVVSVVNREIVNEKGIRLRPNKDNGFNQGALPI